MTDWFYDDGESRSDSSRSSRVEIGMRPFEEVTLVMLIVVSEDLSDDRDDCTRVVVVVVVVVVAAVVRDRV